MSLTSQLLHCITAFTLLSSPWRWPANPAPAPARLRCCCLWAEVVVGRAETAEPPPPSSACHHLEKAAAVARHLEAVAAAVGRLFLRAAEGEEHR